MELKIFQIDAFTSEVFKGNPAAVCPLDSWLSDELMQDIAAENNLAETAFFVPTGDKYFIRWYTPLTEVDLCGHATLASAHVLFNHLGYEQDHIVFESRSGDLVVSRENDLISLDFPANPYVEVAVTDMMRKGLGLEPKAVYRGMYYMAIVEDEKDVSMSDPDFRTLSLLERPIMITTASRGSDFISRFFAPMFGIDEDPVTGSAHCMMVPYWSEQLGKTELEAVQISQRGGELSCELKGDRVIMKGNAVTYLSGTINV